MAECWCLASPSKYCQVASQGNHPDEKPAEPVALCSKTTRRAANRRQLCSQMRRSNESPDMHRIVLKKLEVSEGREATSQIFRKALKGGINLTLDDLISLKEKNFLVGVSKCQSLLIIHFKRCYTSRSVFFSSKNKPLSQQNGFSVCDPCTLSTLSLAPTGKQAPDRKSVV